MVMKLHIVKGIIMELLLMLLFNVVQPLVLMLIVRGNISETLVLLPLISGIVVGEQLGLLLPVAEGFEVETLALLLTISKGMLWTHYPLKVPVCSHWLALRNTVI